MRQNGEAEAKGRSSSGQDTIGAIVRDPETVYLYWQLNGPASAQASRSLGHRCQWYVRVLDVMEGLSRCVQVDPDAGNFYVEVSPGHTYGFELAASDNGRWRTICRTERVQVPTAQPSAGSPGRSLDPERPARRGLDRLRPPQIVGLRFETTDLCLGSSPGRRDESE